MSTLPPELQDLRKFLSLFNYDKITLSVQSERKTKQSYPTTKNFNLKTRTGAFKPDELLEAPLRNELLTLQKNQKAVYFMVNEGDGEASGGNTNCAKKQNVTQLKALFIDTDDCPLKDVLRYISQPAINLKPHITVRSSESKYHLYFLIHPESPADDTVSKWRAIQKAFYYLGSDPDDDNKSGVDKTMADINQVLRLPSFYHIKDLNNLQQIQVTKFNNHEAYNLDDVYERVGGSRYRLNEVVQGNLKYTQFNYPEERSVGKGERREVLISYISHLLENVVNLEADEQVYFALITGFVVKYFNRHEQEEYLPGGGMRNNIEQAYRDLKRGRQNKLYEQKAKAVEEQFSEVEAKEKGTLPLSFYLNFPGGVGMITRNIHSYYPGMPIEFAFAAGLIVAGCTKSYTHRFMGAWPLLNGIILGAPAAGKSTLIRAVQKILKSGGLLNPLSGYIDEPSTVQWLHTRLYTAGGVGVTLLDEAGDFVKALTSPKAAGYQAAVRKYIKESTTGGSEGARITVGGAVMSDLPPIEHGLLSVWMFMQPSMFETSFNSGDVSDGMMARFIQFKGRGKFDFAETDYLSGKTVEFEPSLEVISWMESHTANTLRISDGALKIEIEEAIDKYKIDAKVKKVPKELASRIAMTVSYNAKQEVLKNPKIKLKCTTSAEAIIKKYLISAQAEAKAIQQEDEEDGRLSFLGRTAEMLNRMLCLAADKVVDEKEARYCIKFLKFQTSRFFKQELSTLMTGWHDKQVSIMVKAVQTAFKHSKGEWVTLAEITRSIKASKRSLLIDKLSILNRAVSQGFLEKATRSHQKNSDVKLDVFIPVLPEDTFSEI